MSTKNPPIHLWIYNHPMYGISDQIDFCIAVFEQHGYDISIGRKPSKSALNIVIENFTAESRDILLNFCNKTRKKVGVIMTEHLDFVHNEICIHGEPLWNKNDYMHPSIQVARIRYLLDCVPIIKCFFVLGDLPKLENISGIAPGISVCPIPFPKIEKCIIKNPQRIHNDFSFTAYTTKYRANILELLKESKFTINYPAKFVSAKKRDKLNLTSKIILNIPQREDWAWLSTMRIMNGLRSGRATVSLGTHDNSKIADACFQINLQDVNWIEKVREFIEHWQDGYEQVYENYEKMSQSFLLNNAFPHHYLDIWATTDCLYK